MPQFDADTELKALYDELRRAYKRLKQNPKENEEVILGQISQIKRDIKRNKLRRELNA